MQTIDHREMLELNLDKSGTRLARLESSMANAITDADKKQLAVSLDLELEYYELVSYLLKKYYRKLDRKSFWKRLFRK